MSQSMIPPRASETPLEHATIFQLALTLATKIITHPITIKSGIVIGLIAAYLYIKFSKKKSIRGKTIVLTGAGNGLGRSQAIELAKNGCKVIIWDIDADGLQKTIDVVKAKVPSA